MQPRFSLVLAALAISSVAFGQLTPANFPTGDGAYQIGYAANLNIGDSVVNITNDGWIAGPINNTGVAGNTAGNICANIYVFDPSEEEISCCACLTTPDGLYSLSVKSDLLSNTLTAAVPNSVVIKLIGSMASTTTGGALTFCDPTGVQEILPSTPNEINLVVPGLVAWGVTLEGGGSPGAYYPVSSPFVNASNTALTLSHPTGLPNTIPTAAPNGYGPGFMNVAGTELNSLTTVCNFIQKQGSGYGLCSSCALGALAGAKQ
jgi:hypothetical protein